MERARMIPFSEDKIVPDGNGGEPEKDSISQGARFGLVRS
jgi:hypothetical protein